MNDAKYAVGCLSVLLFCVSFWVGVVWWVWWR